MEESICNPHGAVGSSSSQVDPWLFLINKLCDILEAADLQKIMVKIFGVDYDDDDSDEGMEMDWNEKMQDLFRKRMAEGENPAAKIWDLCQAVRGYYENSSNLKDLILEFMGRCNLPFDEINLQEVFIGRDDETDEIISILKADTNVKCVSICGIGGQGKTTLACHVVVKLNWQTFRADMREKSSTYDMIKGLLPDKVVSQSNERLMEDFKVFLSEIKEPTLLYVDDCDNMISGDRRFYKHLQDIISHIDEQTTKIRFLLTTRKKFKDTNVKEPFKSSIEERELDSLTEPDAVELLRTISCKEIPQNQAEAIVDECANSPLAVTTVASMIKEEQFTVERLLFHLKMDKKNVTKALKIDNCIKMTIANLGEEVCESLVRLTVFQALSFNLQSAQSVCPNIMTKQVIRSSLGSINEPVSEGDVDPRKTSVTHLQMLYNSHLLDVQKRQVRQSRQLQDDDSDNMYSLHPLVYRYLDEWRKKPTHLKKAFDDATKKFVEFYEKKIADIVWYMDTKCVKGMKELELHRNHIMNYYKILDTKKALLKPYPKKSRPGDILQKKRVSDLADLLLPDVQKRRLFPSEASRAKDGQNDSMHIFWTVEEADVYTMLCDKPTIAMELLDKLSQHKYPALRELNADRFYPALVHGLFHKVKGLTRWKQRQHEKGLEHLHLALKFFENFNTAHLDLQGEQKENVKYKNLHAKIYGYIGQIYIELERYDEAERSLQIGYRLVKSNISTRKGNTNVQWDIPRYLGYFGLVNLKKGQKAADSEQKKQFFDEALKALNEGMEVDRRLKLDCLDGYSMKRKVKADVLIEQKKYDAALKEADAALDQRRAIVQPPHFKYAESVYQVARIYLLQGIESMDKEDKESANTSWRTSRDYFREMEDHHLVNGSIEVGHPLYLEIKQDHFHVRELYDSESVKELTEFYKKLESGKFKERAESHFKSFKTMMQTPKEFLQKMFGSGGKEFGEKDSVMQRLEAEAGEEIGNMLEGRYGVERQDSGQGSSSTELGESMSSDGSGSLTQQVRQLNLDKSLSLEDNVFDDMAVKPEKRPIKRQKTIFED